MRLHLPSMLRDYATAARDKCIDIHEDLWTADQMKIHNEYQEKFKLLRVALDIDLSFDMENRGWMAGADLDLALARLTGEMWPKVRRLPNQEKAS